MNEEEKEKKEDITIEDLKVAIEYMQNEFLKRLDKQEENHSKELEIEQKKYKMAINTIRIFIICITIFLTIWVIGYFLIGRSDMQYIECNNGTTIQNQVLRDGAKHVE